MPPCRGRGDARHGVFVNQLFLTVVLENDGVTIEPTEDAGQPFSADR